MSYRAGAANVCITPEEPLWLAGFASRTAPSRGKVSDLYASAVAVEDSADRRCVLASLDAIAVTPAIAAPLAEFVGAKHGLTRDQLLITASHTHYGPEFRLDKQPFFEIPEVYAAKLPAVAQGLVEALVRAIDLALERLEPARLYFHQAAAGFAHNRRRHGVLKGTPSAEDVYDHDVPVLQCVDISGKPIAVLFGYACHNTTIPADDLRYCGDWAGFARQQLEARYPESTALFVPGAGADQRPEPNGSVELAREHGRELATAIEGSLAAPGKEISGALRTRLEYTSLPLERISREMLSSALKDGDAPERRKTHFLLDQLERGEPLKTTYDVPLQVIALGQELLMIALSGEPVVEWSLKLKRDVAHRWPAEGREVWVAGYCNDTFGYLPTRRIQAEGGYEGGRAALWSSIPAPFTLELEDRVTDAVNRLIEEVE